MVLTIKITDKWIFGCANRRKGKPIAVNIIAKAEKILLLYSSICLFIEISKILEPSEVIEMSSVRQ